MRRIRSFFMNMNFKPRLIVYFVLLSVIPVLLIGGFTYLLCSRVIMNMAEDSTAEALSVVCSDVEKQFDDAYALCEMVAVDINVQENARRVFSSIQEQYSADLKGSMDLASISAYKNNIYGVYVLCDNGSTYKSNAASFRVEDFTQRHWYQQVMHADKPVWFAPHEWSYVVKTVNDRYLSVGIPLLDKASGQKRGVVLVEMEENYLLDLIGPGIAQKGHLYIVDEAGDVVLRSTPGGGEAVAEQTAFINQQVHRYFETHPDTKESTPTIIPSAEHLIVYQSLGDNGWRMIGALDKRNIDTGTDIIVMTVAAVLLLVVLCSIVAAVYISGTVSKPLRTLTRLMEQVENGDLSVQMKPKYRDEVGRLGTSFNHMLARMQVLIGQIYESQTLLRRSELRALQAQITPHFLYNSLDSLTWLLRLDKREEATIMAQALTTFFTTSLSKGKEVITFEDELRHVESFLKVESMIYSKKFDYAFEVDSAVKPYRTIKLLLQPLVENSIYHGIKSAETKEHIVVSAKDQGERILLSVRDTGIGIPPDKLAILQRKLEHPEEEQEGYEGYGIHNVNERIRYFFGSEYGVRIYSVYGQGTEVTIHIPKVREGDGHV